MLYLNRFDASKKLLGLGHGTAAGNLLVGGGPGVAGFEVGEDTTVVDEEHNHRAEGDPRIDKDEGKAEKDQCDETGEAFEHGEEHAAGHLHDVAGGFLEENAGVVAEEIAPWLGGDLREQAQAQPVGEALAVPGADVVAGEVRDIGGNQHGDGKESGHDEQGGIGHLRQEAEEGLARAGLAKARGIAGDGEKRKDGGDPDDLEDPLHQCDREHDQRLATAVGRGEEVELGEDVAEGF